MKVLVKSPLNYVGGKYKLLNQILPLLPDDINEFVDLFAGGFNVGINVDAETIYVNDINTNIISILEMFKFEDMDKILNHIENRIKEFQLSEENAQGFNEFRRYYNITKNVLDLYTLMCYSYNNQFRFNNKNEYNSSFGKRRFSDKLRLKLIDFAEIIKSKNIMFSCFNFRSFYYDILSEDSFVYCDPPYSITTAVYNDGNRGFAGWNKDCDVDLFNILDDLNDRNIRFALSNVLHHKGKTNDLLLEWAEKYNINKLDCNYSAASYNTSRGGSEEVLITNY